MASKTMTFETAYEKLEQLVAELEQGGASLERSVEAFEKGMELIALCTDHLRRAELKIAKLVRDGNGNLTLEPTDE
ncbi:exodeoxyribonuclease VII small subunit [bacterium]|nr:exodeoxyribonuclease VII small subunit [bacterium]